MKQELYEDSYKNPKHFSFGKNWQSFLRHLSEESIQEAEKSLLDFLDGKENVSGKTFVDVGCGSGLFSLAAYRLGAAKVVSIDIDDASVACVKSLRRKEKYPENWVIMTGSALDTNFLHSLGTFDIVYSWGVLHHTGNMYQALENVTRLTRPGSRLYIALYNDNQRVLEGSSRFWLQAKKIYNGCGSIEKKILQALYVAYYIMGLALNGVNPYLYIKNYRSLRGMSFMTDIKDWLGGYPYEYASSEEIVSYFAERQFKCLKTKPARSIGCNEFLFCKG